MRSDSDIEKLNYKEQQQKETDNDIEGNWDQNN